MELSDHVGGNYFTDSLACGGARVDRTANSSDVATHNRGHETGVDLFPTNETNIRSFHHRVGSLDHGHESTTFNHSECFRHCSPLPQINTDFQLGRECIGGGM